MDGSGAELVREIFGAFSRSDRERWLSLVHDDAEIVPLRAALEDVVFRGRGAARRFWDATTETWDEARLTVDEVREEGGRVLVIGRFQAVGRESRAPVDTRMGTVLTVRDGKAAGARTYVDPADAWAEFERG